MINELLKKSLDILNQKGYLSGDEAYKVFSQIIDGQASANQIKEFLLTINQHKITHSTLFGAAKALMERAIKIQAPENAIDVCGTGGDQLNSLNISTAVSFVVAACGVCVAKHGNRAASSLSGSADIFSELGIRIDLTPAQAEESLHSNNLAFLFAPLYHPVLKNLAPIRKEIAVKTIFNYLGPLLNPAEVKYQLIGCSDKYIAVEMLKAAHLLGKEDCFVVSAEDGMDEISISSNSLIFKMNKEIAHSSENYNLPAEVFNPENYGFKKVPIQQIQGKDPKYNARKLLDLLQGEKSAYYDIVVLNSALALILAKKANNFKDAILLAREAIDSKKSYNILKKLQQYENS